MINFMKLKWLYFLISALVIVPGIISLVLFGLRPSIDFTGGSVLQVRLEEKQAQEVTLDDVQGSVKGLTDIASIQQAESNSLILKGKPIDPETKPIVLLELQQVLGKVEEVRFESVGPVLGRELVTKTLIALALSAGTITLYVAYRFRSWKFGVCAVLAMLHDSLVLIGAFSLLGHFLGVEIDVLFVTAVLTILSFSVHDTIVVYDRIRELGKKLPAMPFTDLVNVAVTETMGRSLNNSLTIILMLLALWLMGGDSIRWFVFALLIGTITGTYSSTFTAAPLLVAWDTIRRRKKTK